MHSILDAPPHVPAIARRPPRLRRPLLFLALIALGPLVWETYQVLGGSNFHTVIPGRIYRCAQPTAEQLDRIITDHGIRTVINLRGPCEVFEWYRSEAQVTHKHNICQEDISFSAGRLPALQEIRRLVEVLEQTEYPIVFHCRRGADRTGLAVVVALLLTTDMPLEDALGQLGWRYGHVAVGRPAQLHEFLRFYRDWLAAASNAHSKQLFRDWILNHYCPGSCLSQLALMECPPEIIGPNDHAVYQVRALNAGILPWVLNPQWSAGVHLGCHIYDEQDRQIDLVKSGLRDAVVAPGETIDITLVLPPLRAAGRYRVQIDMVDEQQCWFYQAGARPLELELIVRE